MNTELYIENYRLDITTDISALLNFAIDDIKDFSARSTTWSRTIVLPGTANNNKLFGHIFQVGQSNSYDSSAPNVNYNFNAAKSARCILFQDQMQTFKGVLRLLQINISNGFQGRVEYEVSVFGNLVGLNSKLSGALLEDLDFSAYDHIYNDAAIVNSWDNPGGTGVYYPLIDYGTYSTNKHDWDIKTFRPALYIREYIDKMITAAGYRWQAPLFDTPRFKKHIVPHSKKIMTTNQATILQASDTSTVYGDVPVVDIISNPGEFGALLKWHTIQGSAFTTADPPDNTVFTYQGTTTSNVVITFNIQGNFNKTNPLVGSLYLFLYKNAPVSQFASAWSGLTSVAPFQFGTNTSITVSLSPGDTIQWRIGQDFYDTIRDVIVHQADFTVKAAAGTIAVPIQIGDTVNLNSQIPQNIRQVDFLVGIVKLYNLYVYEDKFDETLIYITPYIDFYSRNLSNSFDWTHKLNRNKITTVKPMSELNAKVYQFKFKSDSDYYNDLYRKRYNEGYGDRIYDSQFEFTEQTSSFEICFSGTPLVGYGGEEKVYPTIFKRTGTEPNTTEENTDSNIRILQSKKVTGIQPWNITNGPPATAPVLNTLTRYGYAGHLDDPDIPADDLNFGAPKELFFILTTGSLSSNQFNVYWSNYMREITDKDSKLVTANFYLTTKDILNLDFSKYIYVDGIAFRLNAIKDYDATKPNDCVVELLKVNAASYTEAPPPDGPPDGCYLLWSAEQTLDWDTADELLYGDCNTNPGDGGPPPPPPPDTNTISWAFTTNNLLSLGKMNIYVNGALTISKTTSSLSQAGSLQTNAGDVIKIDVTASNTNRTRSMVVSNDQDGLMHSDSQHSNITYTFTTVGNKNYNISSSVTI